MQIDDDGIWLNHTKANLSPRPGRSFLGGRLIIRAGPRGEIPLKPRGNIPLKGDFHEGHHDLGSGGAEEIKCQDCNK